MLVSGYWVGNIGFVICDTGCELSEGITGKLRLARGTRETNRFYEMQRLKQHTGGMEWWIQFYSVHLTIPANLFF